MIQYNMDFLIAGFIFLVVLLVHFVRYKRLTGVSGKLFWIFIIEAVLCSVSDLITCVLIEQRNPAYNSWVIVFTTVLYALQILVPYTFYGLTQILIYCDQRIKVRNIKLALIPVIITEILVIANIFFGQFFYCNAQGEYLYGPWYLGIYIHTMFFVALAMWNFVFHGDEYGENELHAVWEFVLIGFTCTAIEAVYQQYLLTEFGLVIGIFIVFWTIYNPQTVVDSLTGVFAKGYLNQWIPEQMKRAKEFDVLQISMWKLKQVNKLYGNSVGDQLLIDVAEELKQIIAGNYIFRIHGNQFLIFSMNKADYEKTKKAVLKIFQTPFHVGDERIDFSATICGITDVQELVDSDMMLAYLEYLILLKPKSDKTTLIENSEETRQGFLYEQHVKKYMNTAIEDDLFEVYYQPLYSVKDGRYVTMEALSRLKHSTLGMIPPDIFISQAEKNGQIIQLGKLQFRRVCRFMKSHKELMKRIDSVKFNLSPLELLKPGYSQELIMIIKEYDLPYSWFQFEITETVATEYSEELYETISDFQSVGIEICLDDFGSGYANLNTILKLPFSTVKLDRSMLHGICEDQQVALLYKNMVSIMQNLGHKVVAEGVETQEEVELLKEWGVDLIQGYYYTRPLSRVDLLSLQM